MTSLRNRKRKAAELNLRRYDEPSSTAKEEVESIKSRQCALDNPSFDFSLSSFIRVAIRVFYPDISNKLLEIISNNTF